ncbi:hypothetical protein HDV00_002764 [Rhizophlyctis rosea]|nr:hypothetical protein HDV00_002764 [Rhizophlyctis rosea]
MDITWNAIGIGIICILLTALLFYFRSTYQDAPPGKLVAAKGVLDGTTYKVFVDPTKVTLNVLKGEFWARIRTDDAYTRSAAARLIIKYEDGEDLCVLGDDPRELRRLKLESTKFLLSFRAADSTPELGDAPAGLTYALSTLPGWKCKAGNDGHDIFISYRVSASKDLVCLLQEKLGESAMAHVFLDQVRAHNDDEYLRTYPYISYLQRCLVDGKPWTEGFIQGLLKSRLFVPICSPNALKKMENAHRVADNMLLEWEIALERYMNPESDPITKEDEESKMLIFPIMLGDSDTTSFTLDFDRFPQQKPCHRSSRGQLTVQQIIRGIFQFQGRATSPSTIRDVIPDILQLANAPARPLPADQLIRLADWLKPVDTRDDRIRISREHIEGTRKWLLDRVQSWVGTSNDRVLWLTGVAGVGKSVMAAYAARDLEKQHLLGGSFFCKHNDQQRNDPGNLINSMAYSLAAAYPEYGRALMKVLENEPDVPTSIIRKRFQKLLREPLELAQQNLSSIVLVCDALDECTGDARPDLLNIISNEFHSLPSCVKLFVTSRPDPDIVEAFGNLSYESILPTSADNLEDIRIYSWSRLNRTNFSDAQREGMIAKLDELTNQLAEASGGIFVWAKLALDMIDRERTIEGTLALVDKLPVRIGDLYDRVFTAASMDHPGPVLPAFMRTVLTVMEPVSLQEIAAFIEIPMFQAKKAYEALSAVLVMEGGKIRLLHKSVADYLVDEDNHRSPFFVDIGSGHRAIAKRCLELILADNVLRPNICGLDHHLTNSEQNVTEHIAQNVPQHVRYSCRFWVVHVTYLKDETTYLRDDHLSKQVAELYERKLLAWLEVLGLLNRLPSVVLETPQLLKWWEVQATDSTSQQSHIVTSLMTDSVRFLKEFHVPISLRTLHLYVSALPFTPHRTMLYRTYHPEHNASAEYGDLPIAKVRGIDADWSNCLLSFEMPSSVKHVSITDAGLQIMGMDDSGVLRVWDGETGTLIWALEGLEIERWSGTEVAMSRTGNVVVTALRHDMNWWNVAGRGIEAWYPGDGSVAKCLGKIDYPGGTNCLALSGDGKYFVSSRDHGVDFWNAPLGPKIKTWIGHNAQVTAMAISGTNRVVTGGKDGLVNVWDARGGSPDDDNERMTGVATYAVSEDKRRIITGWKDNTVHVWDRAASSIVRTLHFQREGVEIMDGESVSHVGINKDGSRVVTVLQEPSSVFLKATARARVIVWDVIHDATVCMLKEVDREVVAVGMNLDGNIVVAADRRGGVQVWEVTTGVLIGDIQVWTENVSEQWTTRQIKRVAVRNDGSAIATLSDGPFMCGSLPLHVNIWNQVGKPIAGSVRLNPPAHYKREPLDQFRKMANKYGCWHSSLGADEELEEREEGWMVLTSSQGDNLMGWVPYRYRGTQVVLDDVLAIFNGKRCTFIRGWVKGNTKSVSQEPDTGEVGSLPGWLSWPPEGDDEYDELERDGESVPSEGAGEAALSERGAEAALSEWGGDVDPLEGDEEVVSFEGDGEGPEVLPRG